MDKIIENLADETRQHNRKTVLWHFKKRKGNRPPGLIQVKDWNSARVSDKTNLAHY
jgi:hypothetical protein